MCRFLFLDRPRTETRSVGGEQAHFTVTRLVGQCATSVRYSSAFFAYPRFFHFSACFLKKKKSLASHFRKPNVPLFCFSMDLAQKHAPPVGNKRTLRLRLDPAQYHADMKAADMVYETVNLLVRRNAKENNFKGILETIR